MKYFNQAKKNTTTIVIVYLGEKKQIIFPYAFGLFFFFKEMFHFGYS